jgi:pimeloyl-ACP methyl ester carboxylesterase
MVDLEVRVWVDGPGQPADRVDGSIRESVRAMDRPLYQPGRVTGRSIALNPPANDRLGDLRCPVLAVAGALDVSDVVQAAHRLESAAPNARAVVWADVAHMIGMEVPDRLNALIMDFLGPLRPWD